MRCRCLARCVFPVYAGLEIMTCDSCFYYCSSENSRAEQDQSITVTRPDRFQLLALLFVVIYTNKYSTNICFELGRFRMWAVWQCKTWCVYISCLGQFPKSFLSRWCQIVQKRNYCQTIFFMGFDIVVTLIEMFWWSLTLRKDFLKFFGWVLSPLSEFFWGEW